jgi:hypothetical protein
LIIRTFALSPLSPTLSLLLSCYAVRFSIQ